MQEDKNVDNINKGSVPASGNVFIKSRHSVQKMLMISMSLLIISVLFIILEIPLVTGVLIIMVASLLFVVTKKTHKMLSEISDNHVDFVQSNERQENVIASFSHKIREPLNNLVVIGELLMKTDLDKKQKDLVETFIASNNNMVTTVNELTMESAGNISFEHRKQIKFNLFSTIQNTIELYGLKDNTYIDFLLDSNALSDLEFTGDPIIIKQIFIDIFNKIENHNQKKKAKVSIIIIKPRQSVHECLVEMKLEVDRSIQLIDQESKERNLSARLIVANRGTYTQKCEPSFTRLTIIMPFAPVMPETKKQIASERIEELIKTTTKRKELKDLIVLLVEDNIINQKITMLSLKPLVKRIDSAINGKEALDMIGTSKYDLILMDIQMPVMSGLVAAEKIRALEATTNTHTPILAITANAMLGDKEKCISAGIDDYISKPFQPSLLIEKIRKLLETV